jgi:hypothetical protein
MFGMDHGHAEHQNCQHLVGKRQRKRRLMQQCHDPEHGLQAYRAGKN